MMKRMELEPFFIEFNYNHEPVIAEVKPCCQEDNIVFYGIYINNRLQFTITQSIDEYTGLTWKIAMINADKQADDELVQEVGHQIEKHLYD